MKRPRYWLRGLLLLSLLFLLLEYVALIHLAPRYVIAAVQRLAGGTVAANRVRLSLPFTTTLIGLHLVNDSPQAALNIQRAVITPRWLSIPSKTLWVDSVEIIRPMVRLTRTSSGALVWPRLPQAGAAGTASPSQSPWARLRRLFAFWQVRIGSVRVVDGVIELVDEKPSTTFHGILDHVSFDAGPVTLPVERSSHMSFAIRGEVVGHEGHAAPAYCSGWLDVTARDLQAYCKLEPLAMAAFDPYYHGSPEVRVYTSTLTSSSQWSSQANEFSARVQLELSQLSEGDLSIHGRTIIDVKRLKSGQDPRLLGQITLTGPFDRPAQWRTEFLPGNEPTQQLVTRLLTHGVEMIKMSVWGSPMRVSIIPGSQSAMTKIEAVGKEIKEALEILASPVEEAAETASPAASETPTEPPPPGAPEQAGPPAPAGSESAGASAAEPPPAASAQPREPAPVGPTENPPP